VSWFYAIGIGIALLIPLVTGGSYKRLTDMQWRWPALLGIGAAIQIFVVDRVDMPFRLGFALLIASYVLLLGFCAGNLIHRGMAVVMIGIACNFVAIAVNAGMPVRVPPDWARTPVASTVKHHAEDGRDHLQFLDDIIVLRALNEWISFGDLILVVGLCDLTYQASRRPRRARATARVSTGVTASAPPRLRPAFATVRLLPKAARSTTGETSVDLTADDVLATTTSGAAPGPRDAALERFEHA
jgi:hypothetical protein